MWNFHVMAATLLMATAPQQAQQPAPRVIAVPADKLWQHARSGVIFPRQIGAFPRGTIQENLPSEVDVMAHYEDANTRVSLFLFRPQNADIGLWFSQAELMMAVNPLLTGATPTTAPIAFAPPGSTVPSALRRTYTTQGSWRVTGMALLPVGRWIVKIRASSSTLDPAGINAAIDAAIAAIRWPAVSTDNPPLPARIVEPCATNQRWRSARQNPNLEIPLLTGVLASMAQRESSAAANEQPDAPRPTNLPPLCRDLGYANSYRAVYRDPTGGDSYSLALNDAGSLISVQRAQDALINSTRHPSYGAQLNTPTDTFTYNSFNGVPSPQQVMRQIEQSSPRTSVAFDPENGNSDTTIRIYS